MICVITEHNGQKVALLSDGQTGLFPQKSPVRDGEIWEVAITRRINDHQILLRPVRRLDPPPTPGLLESFHMFASDVASGIAIELGYWWNKAKDLWYAMQESDYPATRIEQPLAPVSEQSSELQYLRCTFPVSLVTSHAIFDVFFKESGTIDVKRPDRWIGTSWLVDNYDLRDPDYRDLWYGDYHDGILIDDSMIAGSYKANLFHHNWAGFNGLRAYIDRYEGGVAFVLVLFVRTPPIVAMALSKIISFDLRCRLWRHVVDRQIGAFSMMVDSYHETFHQPIVLYLNRRWSVVMIVKRAWRLTSSSPWESITQRVILFSDPSWDVIVEQIRQAIPSDIERELRAAWQD